VTTIQTSAFQQMSLMMALVWDLVVQLAVAPFVVSHFDQIPLLLVFG
jgi:hypothetical protein